MKKYRRVISVVLSLCLMLTVLAACSNTGASSSTPTSTQSQSQSETETSIKTGGTLRIDYPLPSPSSWCPQLSNFNTDFGNLLAIYEPICRYDLETNEVVPYLITDFEYDFDANTFTMIPNENVTFSDGSVLDAETLAWNMQYYLDKSKGTKLNNPTSVSIVDGNVVLTYEHLNNAVGESLCKVSVYSKAAFDEHGEEWANTNPVGTGAFVLDTYNEGTFVRFVKNENYWRADEGLPYLDAIECTSYGDTTAKIAAVQNGELDFFKVTSTLDKQTCESYGLTKISGEYTTGSAVKGIVFQSMDPDDPFSNVLVRQAAAYALDSNAIAQALSFGGGDAVVQWATEGSLAYNSDIQGYDYNVEKAKELLSEAGYPDGFSTVINIASNDNNDLAVAIQSGLGAVGIDVEINPVETSILSEMQSTGDFEGILPANFSLAYDQTNNYMKYLGDSALSLRDCLYRPEELLELVDYSATLLDPEEKAETLQEINKMCIDDLCLFVLFNEERQDIYGADYIKDLNYWTVAIAQATLETCWLDK